MQQIFITTRKTGFNSQKNEFSDALFQINFYHTHYIVVSIIQLWMEVHFEFIKKLTWKNDLIKAHLNILYLFVRVYCYCYKTLYASAANIPRRDKYFTYYFPLIAPAQMAN